MLSEIFGRKNAVGPSERVVWAAPEPLQLGYRTDVTSELIKGSHELIVIFSYLCQDPLSQLSVLFDEI